MVNHSLDNADNAEKTKRNLEVVQTRRVFAEMVTYYISTLCEYFTLYQVQKFNKYSATTKQEATILLKTAHYAPLILRHTVQCVVQQESWHATL